MCLHTCSSHLLHYPVSPLLLTFHSLPLLPLPSLLSVPSFLLQSHNCSSSGSFRQNVCLHNSIHCIPKCNWVFIFTSICHLLQRQNFFSLQQPREWNTATSITATSLTCHSNLPYAFHSHSIASFALAIISIILLLPCSILLCYLSHCSHSQPIHHPYALPHCDLLDQGFLFHLSLAIFTFTISNTLALFSYCIFFPLIVPLSICFVSSTLPETFSFLIFGTKVLLSAFHSCPHHNYS